MKIKDGNVSDLEVMRIVIDAVCRITNVTESEIVSKSRLWIIMYARYVFFETAIRLFIKPSTVVQFIGRNRTLIYPYRDAVANLIDTDASFQVDCNNVYKTVIEYFGYDRD